MPTSSREISIEKLHGSANYYVWKFAMRSVLEINACEDAIETVTTKEGDRVVKEKDAGKLKKAKNLIILNVDTTLYSHISKYDNAYDIWSALERLYDDRGLGRKIGLLRSLLSIRLESMESMQHYVDAIVGKANQLVSIGFNLTDEWLVAILLAGLDDKYKPLIMGLEGSSADLDSDDVIGKLIESANAGEAGPEKGYAASKKAVRKRKCFRCKSTTHLIKDCKVKPDAEVKKKAEKKAAFTAFKAAEAQESGWYLDSGASSHMTARKEYLKDVTDRPEGGKIIMADGEQATVKGVGHATIQCDNPMYRNSV